MKTYSSIILVCAICICFITDALAQQDPQYTQYMYNTMSVNPAYVGSKGHATITALGRTQWVGLDGAPDTQTLSFDSPIGYNGLGLGINLVNDKIGPSSEIYLDGNISYTIETGDEGNLAFGLKLGGRLLNIKWDQDERFSSLDQVFGSDINKFLPTIGAGAYYYESDWYLGVAIPNFLNQEHYDYDNQLGVTAVESMHFFFIAGLVLDISQNVKFKPAALVKAVSGAPLSLDISANFMFVDKFVAGLAWRWDDSVSALLGFQITDQLYLGYAYDLTTSSYNVTNTGTHELMLRYEIFKQGRIKSSRFF